MSETMTLIAGRTSKHGTSLNAGKFKDEYREATSVVDMNADDMARLGLQDGDSIRLTSEFGATTVRCKSRKPTDLPQGMLFMAYGPPSSQLMGADTAGTGMPHSKNIEVSVEKVSSEVAAT